MGRIRTDIRVDGRAWWTLFDSGAENTYITEDVAATLQRNVLPRKWRTKLGGKAHVVREDCRLVATVESRPIVVQAYVLAKIGVDKRAKRPFDILFGDHDMQRWGIELDLKGEKLDMSRYPDEFVEFMIA
jgi:hypothetical protein